MSFLVRAVLVIGVLSWFALQRQGVATPGPPNSQPTLAGAGLAAWDRLPAATREAALRAGGAEIARRAAGLPASGDTLAGGDRKPAWRGAPQP